MPQTTLPDHGATDNSWRAIAVAALIWATVAGLLAVTANVLRAELLF